MSYTTNKGVITAKKGKAANAPSVSIQDPLYQKGADLNYWIDVHSEEVVKEVFLKERSVIIQRVGRGILKPDGSNAEKAKAAMIAQCSNLALKRTAAPEDKGLTKAQAEAACTAKGFDINSPKVRKMIDTMYGAFA